MRLRLHDTASPVILVKNRAVYSNALSQRSKIHGYQGLSRQHAWVSTSILWWFMSWKGMLIFLGCCVSLWVEGCFIWFVLIFMRTNSTTNMQERKIFFHQRSKRASFSCFCEQNAFHWTKTCPVIFICGLQRRHTPLLELLLWWSSIFYIHVHLKTRNFYHWDIDSKIATPSSRTKFLKIDNKSSLWITLILRKTPFSHFPRIPLTINEFLHNFCFILLWRFPKKPRRPLQTHFNYTTPRVSLDRLKKIFVDLSSSLLVLENSYFLYLSPRWQYSAAYLLFLWLFFLLEDCDSDNTHIIMSCGISPYGESRDGQLSHIHYHTS